MDETVKQLTEPPKPTELTEPSKIPIWAIAGGIAGVGLLVMLLMKKR
jgi:hypothetical protein